MPCTRWYLLIFALIFLCLIILKLLLIKFTQPFIQTIFIILCSKLIRLQNLLYMVLQMCIALTNLLHKIARNIKTAHRQKNNDNSHSAKTCIHRLYAFTLMDWKIDTCSKCHAAAQIQKWWQESCKLCAVHKKLHILLPFCDHFLCRCFCLLLLYFFCLNRCFA